MDEVRELVWEYVAGRVFPEDLPMAAAQALAHGADTSALRELAGLGRRSDTLDIRDLFDCALRELDIALPTFEQVSQRDLIRMARDLVAGRKSPLETARACRYFDSWVTSSEGEFVSECSYYADGFEYVPAERMLILEAELVELARAVVDAAQPCLQ